jgi:Tfp pilus tip-associated adhesin PilY1
VATGVLVTASDAISKDVQSIYAVWDKPSDTVARPMTRSQLASRIVSTVAGANQKTYYAVAGAAIDWASTTRGWRIDLDFSQGLRVIYPLQSLSRELALISAVTPPVDTANTAVCDWTGSGVNFVLPVHTGVNAPYRLFDVTGDSVYDSADAFVAGYSTLGDGRDAITWRRNTGGGSGGGSGSGGSGGGGGGDGGACPHGDIGSIDNTVGSEQVCIPADPPPGGGPIKDRVWRRLINPPIR